MTTDKNHFAIATSKTIDAFNLSALCKKLCGNKPFGSRHWEYPWTISQSGILAQNNMRILDVAPDFTFPYASFLEEHHEVTFIDLEKRQWSDSVTWGAEVGELANRSDYRIMDVRDMSFADETFEIIFCISVLEHIVCPTQNPDDPNLAEIFSPTAARPALQEMHRCLKPNGKLMLTVDLYGGPKWKTYFEQWDILADIHNAGFNVDHFPAFDRTLAFADPGTFISNFHGPYITLGFNLRK